MLKSCAHLALAFARLGSALKRMATSSRAWRGTSRGETCGKKAAHNKAGRGHWGRSLGRKELPAMNPGGGQSDHR